VADRNPDAFLAQPRDIAAFGRVRALHGVTEIAQDLGDAAHADAADPDEVDGSDLARQSHAASLVANCLIKDVDGRDKPGHDET
jgi:hypothetical protein